jgi:hypothetical protein
MIGHLRRCPRGTTFHEIEHDGFRILARRDAKGVRLFPRNGRADSTRPPLGSRQLGSLGHERAQLPRQPQRLVFSAHCIVKWSTLCSRQRRACGSMRGSKRQIPSHRRLVRLVVKNKQLIGVNSQAFANH